MAQLHKNGETNDSVQRHEASAKANTLAVLIADTQALKDHLRQAYARASRLVAGLKRHRQQSRLVTSTLASLRQLQQIDG